MLNSFLHVAIAFLLLLVVACKDSRGSLYHIEKSVTSEKAMVVSAHPLASEVGLSILKQGGNAADAAIAIQFALAVVYPRAGNIGGGGFMVYRDQTGIVSALDYRERAPLASHRDMYLDSNEQVIEGLSKTGILAAGIPGTVAGLYETYQKLGKLQPWSALVEPAILLAEKGFRITKAEADRLNLNKDAFVKNNPAPFPFVKDQQWQEGDRLIQTELAATLRIIAHQGADGFYEGSNAKNLEDLSQKTNGIITQMDLLSYKPIWREPMDFSWRGFQIHTMSLPSTGGILLNQILHMIDSRLSDSLSFHHPSNVHLLVEAERRAFEDRSQYLGDIDFYRVPIDSILDSTYLVHRFSDFDPVKATISKLPDSSTHKLQKESFETTHLSVVDSDGNAASVTVTLNDNFGCKVWVPGGGYFLNNQMDDFSIKPGEPNFYGLIGAEANAIVPGKRMLSSMTPTIIEKNGKLWMVVGTNGGPTIITSILQVILNTAVFGMNIDDAIQSGRYHHQWLPDEIMYEKDDFSPGLVDSLTMMGHHFKQLAYIGMIEAIMVGDDGLIHGAADHRGDDHAAGW